MNKDGIYLLLPKLVKQLREKKVNLYPHSLLLRLLETKRFPFVITTSFTPIVEDCMRQIWGNEKVRVLQFNNDPNRSMKEEEGDINNENELGRPTVFYMFGKLCEEPHRYAVTDMDLMEFCKSWMTGAGVPRNIAECLKKRYLLFLGGSYNDWLFRFIWFSMRHKASGVQKDNASMFVVEKVDNKAMATNCNECLHGPTIIQSLKDKDSFEKFLERIDAFTQNDPKFVIQQIEQRLTKLDEANWIMDSEDDSDSPDVFLSYSRKDSDAATFLYRELTNKNLNVWFDTKSIDDAEKWRKRISIGIQKTKLFVPLLTHNVEREYLDVHEYRDEWEKAAEIARRIGGRPFIIPVVEKGFDFYNPNTSVPEQFKDINATQYSSLKELSDAAEVIARKLEELKELKKNLYNG